MAAFALAFAFDSSAFALAFDSNKFDWNQMRHKCESSANILLLLHNGYFVSWFRLEYASGRSVGKQLIAVSENDNAQIDRSN